MTIKICCRLKLDMRSFKREVKCFGCSKTSEEKQPVRHGVSVPPPRYRVCPGLCVGNATGTGSKSQSWSRCCRPRARERRRVLQPGCSCAPRQTVAAATPTAAAGAERGAWARCGRQGTAVLSYPCGLVGCNLN